METLFWTLATSYVALSIVAAIVVAALVVGYDPLLKFIPVVGLYIPAAKVIAFLSFGLLCALLDRRSADNRAEVAQLRTDIAFSQAQLANQKATAADKARLADASADAANAAQLKASTYESLILAKPAAAGCDDLDPDLANVLHGIQPRRGSGASKSGGANRARLRGFGKAWSDAGR